MNLLEKFKDYFKTRDIGFYFTMSVVLLSAVELIIYTVAFSPVTWETYMHWSVIFFIVMAIVLGIGLSIFNVTAPWAPAAATLMEFLSFLMFMRYGYMYFSQIFYSGFSLSLFFQMYYGYLVSIFLYIIMFGLGIASSFLKQYHKVEKTTEVKNEIA